MHSGDKPFACDQCEYSNTRRHHLKTHKLTHSGKKPFVCDQCEYSSTQALALKRHKLKHSGDRPHACNQCNHSSTTAQALKTHKMIHNDENPFACDQCEYSSRQASKLKNISYKHTVARGPFHATYANILPLKLWISKDTSYHTVTKSLILVTNVTFPSDSNHTCESTVKKNLTHVSNVTTSVSGLNIWKNTRQGSMLYKHWSKSIMSWGSLNCSKCMTTFENAWHLNDLHY